MNTETDNHLLLRWHGQRDARAFHEIARRHAPMVFATCRRILRNAAEAEDLTQECFLFLARHKGDPPDCVPAWLHVVAVRRSLSHLRALGRRTMRERAFAEEQTMPLAPSMSEVLGEVDDALAALPESLRIPLVLHFLEQRSQDEIAALLGVAQSTISRRLDKGIAELRARLEKKHLLVTASALAAGFQTEAQIAVPASLSAALGKISLAGSSAGATGATGISAAKLAALGGGIVMKKALIGVLGVAVLAYVLISSLPDGPTPQAPIKPIASETETQENDAPADDPAKTISANSDSAPEVPDESESVTALAPDGGGVILGRVLDAVTGEGISGVSITAKWGKRNAAESGEIESPPSDADGAYRITGLTAPLGMAYEVSRDTPDGYRRPTYNERKTVNVSDTGTAPEVDFMLRREVPLSGVVVDQDNRPVSDAMVSLGGGMDIHIGTSTATNAAGAFTFPNLPPTSDLSIVATVGTALTSEPYVFSLPEAGITDLALVVDTACTVSGTIVDSEGKPLAGYVVRSQRVPPTRLSDGTTEESDAAGRFTITGLAAGTYELLAYKPPMGGTGGERVPIVLEAGQALTGVVLVYGGGLSIAGSITNSKGEPVENATVRALGHQGVNQATSDSAGHYAIVGLEEGDYQINVEPTEKYQFAQLGGIPAGTSDLEIVLSDPFSVTGRVLDAQTGQPIPEFEIVMSINWESGLNAWVGMQFQKIANPEGRFELQQSQTYQSMLAARAPGYATAMKTLDLTGPPYVHEVELKLERGGELVGEVVDFHGTAVAKASVYWGKITATGDRAATQSAEDGSFSLPSFPSDPQLISVYHPSYAPASLLVEGTARMRPVEIILMDGGTVEGTVTFAEEVAPKACKVTIIYPEGHYIPEMSVDLTPDGTYRIERVQPGEVSINLSVGTDLPFEERDQISQNVTIQSDHTATVDFEVHAEAGRLDGVIRYPQGALPSRVQLKLECTTDTGTASRSTLVAPDGAFRFEGLPTGPAELQIDANFQNHRRIVTTVAVEVSEDGAYVEIPL